MTQTPARAPAPPTLFCLHMLGGSRRHWGPLAAALGSAFEVVPIDLPGFGENAAAGGQDVAAMADAVGAAIAARRPQCWMLAGHSMGAKVALALARRAEDGDASLAGLVGLLLMAGSPPAPEPMDEARRTAMLGWFRAGPSSSRAEAEDFIDANTANPLPPAERALAIEGVLQMNPAAWRAWLAGGSTEDWQARIGTLATPALVLAGAEDEDLGLEAQQRLMAPHFQTMRLEVVAEAKHMLPLEQPEAVARAITTQLPVS